MRGNQKPDKKFKDEATEDGTKWFPTICSGDRTVDYMKSGGIVLAYRRRIKPAKKKGTK